VRSGVIAQTNSEDHLVDVVNIYLLNQRTSSRFGQTGTPPATTAASSSPSLSRTLDMNASPPPRGRKRTAEEPASLGAEEAEDENQFSSPLASASRSTSLGDSGDQPGRKRALSPAGSTTTQTPRKEQKLETQPGSSAAADAVSPEQRGAAMSVMVGKSARKTRPSRQQRPGGRSNFGGGGL